MENSVLHTEYMSKTGIYRNEIYDVKSEAYVIFHYEDKL